MAPRPPWLKAALQHLSAGRLADAERIYEGVLKVNPRESDALNLLGLIAAHRARFDEAASLIARAIEAAPGRGDFYAALGNVQLAQGRDHEMVQCYRRALCLAHFKSIPASFAELAAHAGSTPNPDGALSEIDQYRSQFLQDVYLDRWVFGGTRGGMFVDIGAHDGVALSNSFFFERSRGWTGLCIEPNPNVGERLQANRRCAIFNGCVAAEAGTVAFRKLSGYSEMLSGMVAAYHPDHAHRVEQELKQFGGASETILVEARTLAALCAENGISEIDYLSIDTEGSELDILGSTDFTKLLVHAATIECNFDEHRTRMIALMDPNGFDMAIALGHDLVFLNRKSPCHAAHAERVRKASPAV